MKTLLTLITSLFAFSAFAQGPVLRTPYTVNTADFVTNIVRNIGTNSTIHAGKLAPGGSLPALNGSAVTSLNGTAIASGTVADARLSANIPKKDAVNVFSASNYISAGMFGDLTVQNNIVGQGNISLNGLLGDPNFATVSLDTSTGDFLTAGSIYLTSGAEMIFGNGGGLSNLQSASLVGALPAIDGSQLTGITGGSGISPTGTVSVASIPQATSATSWKAITNFFQFHDGEIVNISDLALMIAGDSRSLSNYDAECGNTTIGFCVWYRDLTNRFRNYDGIYSVQPIVQSGGQGFSLMTNMWHTVGKLYWTNNIQGTRRKMVFVDQTGRNDQINGQELGETAFVQTNYYTSAKSNFYQTELLARGISIATFTIDPTADNNSGPSNATTDEYRKMYNDWVMTNTQIRFPVNVSRDVNNWVKPYYDGVHLSTNNVQWASAFDLALREPKLRQALSGFLIEGTNAMIRNSDGNLAFNIQTGDGVITTALVAESSAGHSLRTLHANNPVEVVAASGASGATPFFKARSHVDDASTLRFAVNSDGSIRIPGLGGGGNQTVLVDDEGDISAGAGGGVGLPGTNTIIAYGSAPRTNASYTAIAADLGSSNNFGGVIHSGPNVNLTGITTAEFGLALRRTGSSAADYSLVVDDAATSLSLWTLNPVSVVGLRMDTAGRIGIGIAGNPPSPISGYGLATYGRTLVRSIAEEYGLTLDRSDLTTHPVYFGTLASSGSLAVSDRNGDRLFTIAQVSGNTTVKGTLFTTNGLNVTAGAITNNGVVWFVGAGSPEGAVVAPIGSPYSRTDGSTDTALYRKETGTGNTGWVAVSAGGGSGGTNAYYSNTDPDQKIVAGGGDNNFLQWYNSVGARTGFLDENSNLQVQGNLTVAGGSLVVTNQAEPGTDYELAVYAENGEIVRDPGTGIAIAVLNATTINGGSSSIKTNTAAFDVDITAFVVGTRYTNSTRRSFVTASFTLNGAAAGTAAVTLSAEQAGVTNMVKISAGPLASLSTIEQLSLLVGPGAFYYFTDATTGTDASVAIVTGTSSRTDL